MNIIEEMCKTNSFCIQPTPCKYCCGYAENILGNPNGYTRWCCKQAEEDVELERDEKDILRLIRRGYMIGPRDHD